MYGYQSNVDSTLWFSNLQVSLTNAFTNAVSIFLQSQNSLL